MKNLYYSKDELKNIVNKFASDVAWHYVNYTQYRGRPRIFIYQNKLHFDTNSTVFGSSEIIFNHEEECEIVFDNDDLQYVLEDLEIDIDNLVEYEEEIAIAVKNRLEKILENYIEEE